MNKTVESISDRIERKIIINAPRERVWRALTNAKEFGTWFGAKIDDQTFAPGQRVRGQINQCGYEHVWFDVIVEKMEAPHVFSYRWHPCPIDPKVDYDKEEPTLVTFTLKETSDNGTLITVVESGFDNVPPHRRLEAFRMNYNGWDVQLKNLSLYAIK